MMITHTSSGDPIPAGCEIGTFVPTEDETTHTVTHSLGEIPKIAYCLLVPNDTWVNTDASSIIYNELITDPETGVFDIDLTGSHKRNNVGILNQNKTQFENTTTYTAYPASMTSSSVTFATGRYYNGRFKANATYIYILIK